MSAPHGAEAGRRVLDVRGLSVAIGGVNLVTDLDLHVAAGECVALVGPSGSGKSVTARAVLGLSAPGAVARAAQLDVEGVDLRHAPERTWRRVRGTRVGYVGQEALGALDPLRPVGREVADALRLHTDLSARERIDRVGAVLERVGLDPQLASNGRRAGTLSGGMRQRALIAAAIVGEPALIVADEPTTALDAGVSVTVMEILRAAQDAGTGVLLITHDMGLVAGWADRVAVVSDGRIVETGSTASVLESPVHPVTRALVAAAAAGTGDSHPAESDAPGRADVPGMPGGADVTPGLQAGPVLRGTGLDAAFDGRRVVDDLHLAVMHGRTLGVVGASGSGKTTLVRMLLGLHVPDHGSVTLDGAPWVPLAEAGRRGRRHRVAAVVQDPGATFDERWSVERVLVDALTAGRARRASGSGSVSDAVDAALARVELDPDLRHRSPASLSGGQRQRLAIARALATEPGVLVLDEPVTALDAAVQDAVLRLLERLQRETGTAMVFVSHDLDAVRRMSDDVLVMDAGVVVESGPVGEVLHRPCHPVTAALLAAAERLRTRGPAGPASPAGPAGPADPADPA